MKKFKKAVGFIFIVIAAAVLWIVCAYAENSCPTNMLWDITKQ